MYGIIDYKTKWVVCRYHHHRYNENAYMTDYEQSAYAISKFENYISKTNWYAGTVVYKEDMRTISDEQYNFLIAECEKVMKAKSLLTTTLSALVGSLPKPKIDDDVITDVEFE